jgi:uncharacterized membrane protein YgcG
MRFPVSILWAVLVACGASTSAHAGWHELWTEFDLHRRRSESWPEPFVLPDREAVRTPFRIMADNGWKQQNTMNEGFFDRETNELTVAGRAKLQRMLNELPPHRRQVYVLEGPTPQATTVRVTSVCKYLGELVPGQPLWPVMTTTVPAPGGEGKWIERSYWHASEAFSSMSGAGGGSGGGSSGSGQTGSGAQGGSSSSK